MKLATFLVGSEEQSFGVVLGDRVVPFGDLAPEDQRLGDMMSYLRALPESRDAAAALLEGADSRTGLGSPMSEVSLLQPILSPAAILDCGLTPRHLGNSAATLMRCSMPRFLGNIAAVIARKVASRVSDQVRYFKGNCQSVSGDGDEIPWPPYTQYLDVEPELAVVTGSIPIGSGCERVEAAIAGYTIFNDVSARDVQLPEMFFTGPATSKDLDRGNGLGPWLVTADEFGDPLGKQVEVRVGGRARWRGTTNEYAVHPVDAVTAIVERQSLSPGTVIGFGTVPDTCGLDHGDWLRPGDDIAITISGLGTLHQRLGVPATPPSTPWAKRDVPGLG